MRPLVKRNVFSMESIVEDLTVDSEIDSTVNSIVEEQKNLLSLESSLSQLLCLESASIELIEQGVPEETVVAQLSTPIITAVERVDGDIAEEVSLEADNSKGFWNKVKETVSRIWKAIKDAIKNIIDWLISLFQKRKNNSNISKSSLNIAKNMLAGLAKLDTKEIMLRDEYCIGDSRTTAENIVKATTAVASFNDLSEKFALALLKDANEVIFDYNEKSVVGGRFDIQRIDKIERTEKNLGFSNVEEINKRYQDMRFKEFVGFTDEGGAFRSAKAPADAKIESATKEQCLDIIHDLNKKLDADAKGNVANRLETQLKEFQKQVDGLSALYDKAGNLDKELIDKLRTLPAKVNMVFSVIRQWFTGTDIKATVNAFKFVLESIKVGSPEKSKSSSTQEKK